jgi:RNA polymerase sigma-70 factor (ECF subfamily)
MQALHSQIEDEPNLSVQTWERNITELQAIVSRHLPLFYRRAYRYVGNTHDAEDAVQDALLSAYRHLDQFKGSAKMMTWLTSIVTNSALSQLRRRQRQPTLSLDEQLPGEKEEFVSDRLADVRPNPEDECVMSELHDFLVQSQSELSPSLREAIQLRVFDGLTTSEAAHILGVPEGTMKARISRARSQLKQHAKLGLRRTSVIAKMQEASRLSASRKLGL